MAEQRHGLAESHVVVEFDEANHIAAATAAIAVEKILGWVHHKGNPSSGKAGGF
jgi:hypothetical protein